VTQVWVGNFPKRLGNSIPGPNYQKLKDFIRIAIGNNSGHGTADVRLFATSRMFAYIEFVNAADAADFVRGNHAICIGDDQLAMNYWDASVPIPPNY
jgi:hypothetical protein